MRQFKKEQSTFDQNIKAARQISRNTVYRLILLSASIIGFSVSFFSIPFLQSSLEIERLKLSWYAFLVVIVIGVLILFLSGRIRYGKTWKSYNVSQQTEKYKDYTLKEKYHAWLIVLWTLIHPANLVFNKPTSIEERKNFQEKVNGLVVHYLARLEHGLLSFLENVFLVLFVISLIILVTSFQINTESSKVVLVYKAPALFQDLCQNDVCFGNYVKVFDADEYLVIDPGDKCLLKREIGYNYDSGSNGEKLITNPIIEETRVCNLVTISKQQVLRVIDVP